MANDDAPHPRLGDEIGGGRGRELGGVGGGAS